MPIFPGGYSEITSVESGDFLLISDSSDSNAIKKIDVANINQGVGIAESYIFDNAIALTIDEVDEVHPVPAAASGVLVGFTRADGFRIEATGVTAFTDKGGGIVGVETAAPNTFASGDICALDIPDVV